MALVSLACHQTTPSRFSKPSWYNNKHIFKKCQKKNDRLKIEVANERQIILELKAKMSDVGELRASNMELIDQLEKAKIAVDKLTNIRDKQKTQIQVRKMAGLLLVEKKRERQKLKILSFDSKT